MKLKHLSYAVTLALGASLAPDAALADHYSGALFPYVVKDTNRTTVLTLIANSGTTNTAGLHVHLQYWTKSTTAANTAACEPNSSTMVFTVNDMATWDSGGLLGPGPLFGDTTTSAPLGASISYAGPRHGYLIAEARNPDGSYFRNNTLAGYWVEVDIANGAAHGHFALNDDIGEFGGSFSSQHKLTDMAVSGPIGIDDDSAPVAFWPTALVSTVFTVTPTRDVVGGDMVTNENNVSVLQVFNANGLQGAYDRNENGIDGTLPQTVRCVGTLTPAQLMPGVVINAAWAAQGGWGHLVALSGANQNDAVVYQIDRSTAAGAGKFMGTLTPIVSETD